MLYFLENFVISGGESQTLTVFKTNNASELTPVAELRGHERSVECVSAKQNSPFILSGGFDKCLKIWKMGSGLLS